MMIIYKKFLTVFLFFFSIFNFYGCDGGGSGDGTVTTYSTFNSGTLDATFNMVGIIIHDNAAGGSDNDRGNSIVIDSAKNVYVTGHSSNTSGNDDMVIWKYNSNGNLVWIVVDDNADDGVAGDDIGKSIAIDSSENLYVTGSSYNGDNNDMVIWKYNSDGALDASFGNNGIVISDYVDVEDYGNSIVLDSIGNIYVTGSSNDDMVIWKYNSDGMLDTSFDVDGIVLDDGAAGGNLTDIGKSIAVDSAGYIYVTGTSVNDSDNNDTVIWKYKSDGMLDTNFDDDGIVTYDNTIGGDTHDQGNSIAVDPFGKIYVTGKSHDIDDPNLSYMVILKYKSGGDLDTTFSGDGIVLENNSAGKPQDQGNSISVNTAGDIYVAGSGLNIFSKQDMVVWKYKSSGYLDTSFGGDGIVVHSNAAGGSGDDIGNSIVWDNMGKIYIAGQSNNADANDDMVIWKYR